MVETNHNLLVLASVLLTFLVSVYIVYLAYKEIDRMNETAHVEMVEEKMEGVRVEQPAQVAVPAQ